MAGRSGITYEQVAAAADSLVGAGRHPSITAVREALGNTGSPNTIHKHMAAWRAARPQAVAAAAELPAELIAALAGELTKAASTARGAIEGDLAQAQAEAAELANVGEALEQERDMLLDQVATLTTERDQAQATSAERYSEIERQATVIAREQLAAENARIELAKAQLKIESVEERNREFHTEVLRLRDLLKEAEHGKQTAEQQAAVSAAQLAAEQAKSVDLAQRLATAEKAVQDAQQAAESARREANTARIAEQASQARLESAAREIESAKLQVKEARDEAKAAQSLAGELRGQLIAAQAKASPEA
ncbi:hypothetical protein EQ828_23690 [Ectopseudomonas mendocina]|nr:DNA-binding protein [Pseudomonas mendocina]TRO11630.1 hypothetical protein EQ828_23690 [Pseudomonas mendocina]